MASRKSGLGKGLASLIPGAQQLERRQLDTTDRLLDSIASAGFELLEEGHALGLCAYLHASHQSEPRLWLRRPAFETLTPTRAFRLFHGLSMLTNLDAPTGGFEWEGLHARYVRSAGRLSDGIHVVAKSSGRFDGGSEAIVETICGAFADLAHQVQAGHPDDLPPTSLRVEPTHDDRATAVAEVRARGEIHVGHGDGAYASEAIARAVFDAIAPDHRFVDHRILPVDDRQAVLVVATDGDGHVRVGLEMASGDPHTTVANAVLRCVMRNGVV